MRTYSFRRASRSFAEIRIARRRGSRASCAAALLLCATALGCATTPAPPPKREAISAYVVGAPDELHVTILPDPAIERDTTVRPDGMISLDLIGDVPAAGRSVSQIAADVEQRIARFKRGAAVTVSLKAAHSNAITVLGEVRNPQSFPLFKDTRVVEAIGHVGGPIFTASTGKRARRAQRRRRGRRLSSQSRRHPGGRPAHEHRADGRRHRVRAAGDLGAHWIRLPGHAVPVQSAARHRNHRRRALRSGGSRETGAAQTSLRQATARGKRSPNLWKSRFLRTFPSDPRIPTNAPPALREDDPRENSDGFDAGCATRCAGTRRACERMISARLDFHRLNGPTCDKKHDTSSAESALTGCRVPAGRSAIAAEWRDQ